MAFLTPLAFIAALLAVPIILLYMLRLRRREVFISSTFLWQQIVQDTEANTPWQRLRRNLLLFLQLLILAVMILALARPFITVPTISSGQTALLIDASASMNATDAVGDASRFAQAQRRALEIITAMSAGDSMTIIRVGSIPQVLTPYTSDQQTLRAAVDNAAPGKGGADWVAALTLATAGAVNPESFNLVIISDGGLGAAEGLPGVPEEALRYIPVGASSDNVGISAFATRAEPGQPPQLFARLTNYGDSEARVIFSLRADGELLDAREYVVAPKSDLPLVSATLPDGFRTLQGALTLPSDATTPNYLADDDLAWAINAAGGDRQVLLMTPGNRFIAQALRSLPGITSFSGDLNRGLPAQAYDVYIFDSWLPDGALPDGDLLIINPPQSTDLFTVGATTDQTGGKRVLSDDPRMQYVDFGDVNILRFTQITAGWATALASADGGALLLAGEIDGRQVAIVSFDLRDSDLPLKLAWPILMANLLNWFTPADVVTAGDADGLRVGETLEVRPPLDADTVRITLPDDQTRDLPIDRETLIFAETDQPGSYQLEVLRGGELVQSAPFAVNLFSAEESEIAPRETLTLGTTEIAEAGEEELGEQEFWPIVLLGALLLLLIEWYVYHQRVRMPTLMQPQPRIPRGTGGRGGSSRRKRATARG